jgi:hypothetical protein
MYSRCHDNAVTSINWSKPCWRLQLSTTNWMWRMRRRISKWGPFAVTNFTFCCWTWGLPTPLRQVVLLISHIHSYLSHCSPPYHQFLTFSSTALPSSPKTRWKHLSLYRNAMVMSWHRAQAYNKYSIHRVQHTLSTGYTEYSIQGVQHPPTLVCLPIILMITSWLLTVPSVPSVPPYTIHPSSPRSPYELKVKLNLSQPDYCQWHYWCE